MKKQKHRKNSFRDFIPWIIMAGMTVFAMLYIEVAGMTNLDFINRTANFWIVVDILSVGYGAVYAKLIVDVIREKDYLKLFFLVANGVVIISSVVCWYILQTQVISVIQSIDCNIQSGNFNVVHKLRDEQIDLLQRNTNLSVATIIIFTIFCEAPRIIRRFINWKEHIKGGEDQ